MRHALVPLTLLLVALPAPAAEKRAKDTPVDRAIDRALEYLDKVQDKADGAWPGGGHGKNPAITSLAVMAFLSAGHVPGEGRYGKTVEKGVRWVLKQQLPNGLIATRGGHEMYHHGIATLMLAEVAGMTDKSLGKDVRRALEDAVRIILKAQRDRGPERGGWRYTVAHIGSDISVTGWQLMALRAAKNLGCDVPAENIDRAVEYIKRCQDSRTGGFCYMPHGHLTIPCTGTSVLALEICGKDRHHSPEALRGGAYLIRDSSLPRWNQANYFYGIYYGAQATFQLGDSYWSKYRRRLHGELLDRQKPSGYWMGPSDARHGATYCTAMAVLALTVEYRYLPIYQRGEEPTDRPR